MSDTEFNLDDYTAEKVTIRIEEFRLHIKSELLPGARLHQNRFFVEPFVEYLDAQAERFAGVLIEPMDLLALVCRNLLELFAITTEVFSSDEARKKFVGEMFLDADDIRTRIVKMGIPEHMLGSEPREWDTIPEKRFIAKRDAYDDYMFKLCSKCIHPTALSILAAEACPGPFIFYFFALHYLAQVYNFLSDQVFPTSEAWKAFIDSKPTNYVS